MDPNEVDEYDQGLDQGPEPTPDEMRTRDPPISVAPVPDSKADERFSSEAERSVPTLQLSNYRYGGKRGFDEMAAWHYYMWREWTGAPEGITSIDRVRRLAGGRTRTRTYNYDSRRFTDETLPTDFWQNDAYDVFPSRDRPVDPGLFNIQQDEWQPNDMFGYVENAFKNIRRDPPIS